QTYEHIRRGANYEDALQRILATREAFRGRETLFLLNSTTMQMNLDESIELLEFWDERDFEVVRYLPMTIRYPDPDLIRQSLYPIRERVKQVFDDVSLHVIRRQLRASVLLPFLYDSQVRRDHPDSFRGLYVISRHPQAQIVPSVREMFQLGHHPLMR